MLRGNWDALNQLVPLVYERLRQIVVDRARRRGAAKRGAAVRPTLLDEQGLGVDARTVNRDWRAARALLYRALSGAEAR